MERDVSGRVLDFTDSTGKTVRSYDNLGRLEREVSPQGSKVSYGYNVQGLLDKVTYPDGYTVSYVYDEHNRLINIQDLNGRSIAEYRYNKFNQRTFLEYGNGAQTLYEYYPDGKFKNTLSSVSGELVLDYEYDELGNCSYMRCGDNKLSYEYDKGGMRLTEVKKGGKAVESYEYDKSGNLTFNSLVGGLGSHTVNKLNQYTRIGETNLKYDADGNLIEHSGSGGGSAYAYDFDNRLVSVKSLGMGTETKFEYDMFGRRVSKTAGAVETKYVYDARGQVVYETQQNTETNKITKTRYIYGPNLDEIVAMQRDGKAYYYHHDRLGSVIGITSQEGEIVEQYEYTAFGKVTIKDADGNVLPKSQIGNPYYFTGRRLDVETGLYYYRNRYYSPLFGRFITRDPAGIINGPNLYAYCGNNPVNFVDPWGLCGKDVPRNVFRIRTIAGAGGGFILGGEFTTYEIEHVATGKKHMYSFGGVGASFSLKVPVGGSGPSGWTDFYTEQYDLDEQSFSGYAIVTWIGGKVGVGGGIINIDWITGDASGENAAGIGWETGAAVGAQSSHGAMFKR
ncbi:MAG: hypothetical protein PHC58_06735 [Candidatus Omnitrophica bacterium]|nr:hypothetical protein [Candidatus Omnitrophota bacterium]